MVRVFALGSQRKCAVESALGSQNAARLLRQACNTWALWQLRNRMPASLSVRVGQPVCMDHPLVISNCRTRTASLRQIICRMRRPHSNRTSCRIPSLFSPPDKSVAGARGLAWNDFSFHARTQLAKTAMIPNHRLIPTYCQFPC
jgi:hypothetical protein